ncbi:MAG: peroxiredoxin [Myxococcales bacterium]|nr:peroxiredoxin [Myxococcales bacterium]MBL0197339.1 peroxiredoxin [Myxococcales bacterium]
MLKANDDAPKLTLHGDDGKVHEVGGAPGTVIVYFYPKDDTPGCTTEAKEFSVAASRFAEAGAVVYGVSKDSVASHCKFRDKYGLSVRLLSDPDLSAHTAFGAYGEKTMYGKKVMGTIRSTFVLRDGKVARVFPKVKVAGHVDAVLAALAELAQGGGAKQAAKAPRGAKQAAKAPAAKKRRAEE